MESALAAIIRGVVVPLAVLGAFAIFRKWLPVRSSAKTRDIDWDSDELYDRFTPWRGRVIGGMLLILAAFLFGAWFTLSRLNQAFAFRDEPQAIHLLPQTAIWWLFPAFGALSLSWEITLQLLGLCVGRETANLFSDWTNQTTYFWGRSSYSGMDSRRVLRWLSLLVALPIGVFTFLAVPMHATVSSSRIRDCGYWLKPCKEFSLGDAQRITEIEGFRTTDGKLTRRAGLVVDFKDGSRWSTADWGNFDMTVDSALGNMLLEETRLPLAYAATERDIPPLSTPVSRYPQ
jgi:hypothetical protein